MAKPDENVCIDSLERGEKESLEAHAHNSSCPRESACVVRMFCGVWQEFHLAIPHTTQLCSSRLDFNPRVQVQLKVHHHEIQCNTHCPQTCSQILPYLLANCRQSGKIQERLFMPLRGLTVVATLDSLSDGPLHQLQK